MARLYLLLFLVEVAAAACALISCLSAEDDEIQGLPRLVWVLIILLFPLVGSIAWFMAGRPTPAPGGPATRPAGRASGARRPAPLAPDDDPEFLGSIGQRRNADQELFARWEADLRRREDDVRRREREAGRPDDPQPSRPEDTQPET